MQINIFSMGAIHQFNSLLHESKKKECKINGLKKINVSLFFFKYKRRYNSWTNHQKSFSFQLVNFVVHSVLK